MALRPRLSLGDDTLVEIKVDRSLVITVFHHRGHIDSEVSLEPKDVQRLIEFLKDNYEGQPRLTKK